MAWRQFKAHITVLVMASVALRHLTSQQCGTDLHSVYQMMLQGHTFKTLKTQPVPLGSVPGLPADSCKEIKASEGGQAVSGNYWLDSPRTGNSILARCDMKTEVADYCIKHKCQNSAACVNRHLNYTCACTSSGWTLPYCEKDINECKVGIHDCHSNAECQNTNGSYICSCKPGFQGDGKQSCNDTDECNEGLHDCHSNAKCKNTEGSHTCTCKPGFAGDGKIICNDINECTEGSDDCHSKAECKNTIGNHQCTCKQGFYGDGRTSCTGQKEFGEVKDPCPKH